MGIGNDTGSQKRAYIMHQAQQLAVAIEALQTAGAQTILVHGEAGDDPTVSNGLGNFASLFDNTLFAALTAADVHFVESDLSTMANGVKSNPTHFGFTADTIAIGTNATVNTSSAFINFGSISSGWGQWGAPTGIPSNINSYAYLRAPNAEYTSFYSDDQHFSTQGQQIEADYDLAQLFAAGAVQMDSIDLEDIGYAFATTFATYSGTTAGGTLTVTDGTHTTKLTLSDLTGDYTAANFVTATDGHGGTAVIEAAPIRLGAGRHRLEPSSGCSL